MVTYLKHYINEETDEEFVVITEDVSDDDYAVNGFVCKQSVEIYEDCSGMPCDRELTA